MSDHQAFAYSPLRRFWQQWRHELGLILAIVVVIGITLCFNRAYLLRPAYNATEILRQTSLLGIFALGAAIVIISGGIDLSSGAVIAFSGSICAQIFLLLSPVDSRGAPDTSHLGPLIVSAGIAGALIASFLIGTLHTWLITIVGLPPFVATLASLVGLRSLAKVLNIEVTKRLGNQSIKININDPAFTYLGKQWWIPLSVFLVLGALAWMLLSRTVIGRHLYAMGGNEQAARLSGIRTDRLKWLAYAMGAMTASIAGVLYTAEVSAADPQTQARGYELNAIAAAVVGGCSLQGGVGQVPGVMLGVLFLRVVIDAVAKVVGSGSDDYEGLIVGFLVVLAVAFNAISTASGTTRKQFFPGLLGWVTIPTLALLAGCIGILTAGDANGIAAGFTVLVVLGLTKFVESRANR
jgi:ribose/xylose/arabinose/galactoside ABC-type transport system permease subunit